MSLRTRISYRPLIIETSKPFVDEAKLRIVTELNSLSIFPIMNRNTSRLLTVITALSAGLSVQAQTAGAPVPSTTEATLYSTLSSKVSHRPEMAMDSDENSFFQSVYGMSAGDDFTVLFSQPLPLRSLRVSTGNADGDNLLTKGFVETSADGTNYSRAATFDAKGIASATLNNRPVAALRIKLNAGTAIPALVLREITLDSSTKISHVSWGAGRAFSDYSRAPDLKNWVTKAERQMKESWADTAAMLYSPGFITPNKVNVIYRTGPGVTGVAAVGGGEMEVNIAWARAHPEDTGLTVHEVAHVVQAMSAYNPVWLIEGVADYVRWVKFEPQNFTVRINPEKASFRDSYRTTGAFLAWCELNYDSRLVTKLNHDVRFGNYSDANFKRYTGKDVDTLWSEFLVAYKTDPVNIITPPVAAADRPRALPVVTANTSVAVDLSKTFNAVGITKDGAVFGADNGFDGGGASFSSDLLGRSLSTKNVNFALGAAGTNNIVAARGNVIALPPRKFSSLWFLGAAIDGAQRAQTFKVTYSDGTTQTWSQNLSDWFAPQSNPGESRALKMDYRNMANGARDARSFSLYAYGFALDGTKSVQSVTLPENPNVRIAAISLGN